MKALPQNVIAYKETPYFDENSTLDALRKDHRTLADVWGKIVVLEGQLTYVIQEPEQEKIELSPGSFGVVEPQVYHHVIPKPGVKFYVEFYR